MLYKIWEYFIIILESVLFFILSNSKLSKKNNTSKSVYLYQCIFLLIISIIELFANDYNIPTFSLVIGILLSHIIYSVVFFKDTIFSKIIWSVIYSVLAIIADSTSLIIPIYILHYPKEEVLNLPGIIRVIFTLLYILILSAFIFTLTSIGIKSIRLSGLQKIIALTISITCILIEQMNLVAIINLSTTNGVSISINISIFFLVFFLYFCLMIYIYNLGIEKEKNENLIAERFISKMNQIQYEQIISSTEILRGIKHDIFNHLETLSLLIKSKEYQKATSYIKTISSELSINHKLVSTGNIPIDCIISNKYALAINKQIKFDYTIHLPKKLPLNDVSICSLLGNILDNAIESCEKVSSPKKRYISLTLRPFNNMLLINSTNSSIGDYKLSKSGGFLTTKQSDADTSYHGIGINQIRRIVKEHKGFIRISPELNSFTLEIMIPLQNQ